VTSKTGKVITAPTLLTTGAGSTVDSNGNLISVNSSGQVTDTTGIRFLQSPEPLRVPPHMPTRTRRTRRAPSR
jgi:hypothetical protein